MKPPIISERRTDFIEPLIRERVKPPEDMKERVVRRILEETKSVLPLDAIMAIEEAAMAYSEAYDETGSGLEAEHQLCVVVGKKFNVDAALLKNR